MASKSCGKRTTPILCPKCGRRGQVVKADAKVAAARYAAAMWLFSQMGFGGMKTQGEIEAAIGMGMSRFVQEHMGRGPKVLTPPI